MSPRASRSACGWTTARAASSPRPTRPPGAWARRSGSLTVSSTPADAAHETASRYLALASTLRPGRDRDGLRRGGHCAPGVDRGASTHRSPAAGRGCHGARRALPVLRLDRVEARAWPWNVRIHRAQGRRFGQRIPGGASHDVARRRAPDPHRRHGGRKVTSCRERLKSITGCCDVATLKSAVSELCTEFGRVTRIDVFTMTEAEKRSALCFLRLESPAQECELMTTLGASRFGEDVLVVLDLQPADASSTR